MGKITASRAHRVINGTPKGWQSLMAEMYREVTSPDQVLAEEPVYSEDMEHGQSYEDAARACAELELGVDIIQVGFALDPLRRWLGASVDGLILREDGAGLLAEARRIFGNRIGADGSEWLRANRFLRYVYATVEIKCFTNISNHAYVWTNKRALDRYVPQVQTQNMVFQAPKSLFVSYHEDMPDTRAKLAIVECDPDLALQGAILGRATAFNADFEMYCKNGGSLPIIAPTIPRRF